MRSTVYQIGVREGDESDWEFVRDKYLTEIVASEKRTLMRAMAATENVKLIDIMLNEMATDDSVILTQGTGFNVSGHASIDRSLSGPFILSPPDRPFETHRTVHFRPVQFDVTE